MISTSNHPGAATESLSPPPLDKIDFIEFNLELAHQLFEQERYEEAKQIYRRILFQEPGQYDALNNLGVLLNAMGRQTASIKFYREAVEKHPEKTQARVNLATALFNVGELEEARLQFEAVLKLDPDHLEAHQGLSFVLVDLSKEEEAQEHRWKGFSTQPVFVGCYRGTKNPIRILLLTSPYGRNSPIVRFLDTKIFLTTQIMVDFFNPNLSLPPHDLVINAVGDADYCKNSLEVASDLVEKTSAPVINPPQRIILTGREHNAKCLKKLEGVKTPRMLMLNRSYLLAKDAVSFLATQGFGFPLLLRTPGFHGGEHFLRVEHPEDLALCVNQLPGQELTVIQYLDARDEDGNIRKYRVMMIGGKLYPLHKAVSKNWIVHFATADMNDCPHHRKEDAAFLEDMPSVLGPLAMRGLEQIQEALALDYGGVDFSLGPLGEVFLYETNATMCVPFPARGKQWDYRRSPVLKIHEAVRELLINRAQKSQSHF